MPYNGGMRQESVGYIAARILPRQRYDDFPSDGEDRSLFLSQLLWFIRFLLTFAWCILFDGRWYI